MHIVKLHKSVISKIAAGEVIQKPKNALKELIENSIDANSTKIQIVVQNGGFSKLHIVDNGDGIDVQDFDKLCMRFATSKLKEYGDLESIQSFGFRGEALASISHVAKVCVVSKTKGSDVAYRGYFEDGVLVPGGNVDTNVPQACAGNPGTLIKVEDLFYNMHTRRQALKNSLEQYKQIVDVVSKYAVHYADRGVGFVCKKFKDKQTDLITSSTSNSKDAIQVVYGQRVAKELIELNMDTKEFNSRYKEKKIHGDMQFKVNGYVTNANYSIKKGKVIIFINNRLVECPALKRACEFVYTQYLPKSGYAFMYLALEIPGCNIDVNVHPTKQQVNFLYQDEICNAIAVSIESLLQGANASRTFYAQTIIAPRVSASDMENRKKTKLTLQHPIQDANMSANKTPPTKKKIAPQKLVRTDHTDVQMDRYLSGSQYATPNKDQRNKASFNVEEYVPQLASISNLLENIKRSQSKILQTLLQEHTFVGIVDKTFCLLQHETKLFMLDYTSVFKDFLYQQVIYNFERIGQLQLKEPMDLRVLVNAAMVSSLLSDEARIELNITNQSEEDKCDAIVTLLQYHGQMLTEYFSLEIMDGNLTGIPSLFQSYQPSLYYLPEFLVELAVLVNWDSEIDCFHDIAMALATFYGRMPPTAPLRKADCPPDEATLSTEWFLQHEFLSVMHASSKVAYLPAETLKTKFKIMEVACLNNLYKIFERC